jgi:uncharacterized protein (DUF488 family)
MTLYTFGYEGLTLETFIARLVETGVKTVIDVRELPLSRKKGFSKRGFAQALHSAGVAYLHRPALGCPKPIRNLYRKTKDWAVYTRQFDDYLGSQSAAVLELARVSNTTPACLVCFEADYRYCHRSMVARAAARAGGPRVIHLTARTMIPEISAQTAA